MPSLGVRSPWGHTTNTTTRRPEAMKRRGEKKRLVKAQQTYHMRADCKTLPTELLQPYNILLPWLLCSALFLYAFATLLGLSGGGVSGLNTTTTHPSFQGRRKI